MSETSPVLTSIAIPLMMGDDLGSDLDDPRLVEEMVERSLAMS